jgi:alkylated DNA repair dioxygenase AlkB
MKKFLETKASSTVVPVVPVIQNVTATNITKRNYDVDFYEQFIENHDAIQKNIMKHAVWTRPLSNRRTNITYGNTGLVYKITFGGYGGRPKNEVHRKALPWDDNPIIKNLRDIVSNITGEDYNFCVLQYYPNGNIGINPHKDKEMVKGTTICGISFGETRRLIMSGYGENETYSLTPGSMYVLNPPTNSYYTHCIQKEPNLKKARISLTFRNVPMNN